MSDQHSPPVSASNETTATAGSEQNPRWIRKTALDGLWSLSLAGVVRRVGFWVAVVLPFLHLPLLFSGIDTSGEVVVYLSLLAVNVLALVLGHTSDR
jgi:hypothetical protein